MIQTHKGFELLRAFLLCSSFALGQCEWSQSQTVGELDAAVLPEASGLARSSVNPSQLYHVNDSGDALAFYVSDLMGENLQRVGLESPPPGLSDLEDIAMGPCGNSSCLFLGDIGGNTFARDTLRIFVVEEQASWTDISPILYTLTINYPDAIDDAEGLAVHPNGDIYILSKAILSPFGTVSAKLYRLDNWQQNPDAFHTLSLVAELDLAALSQTTLDLFSHVATALAISPDGNRFSVLSYGNLYEFALDLSSLGANEAVIIDSLEKVSVANVERLPQQESLAYLDAKTLLYGSEARGASSELRATSCRQRNAD